MTRQKLTIAAVAAVALSVSPVWAGQRERPSGSESTGSAQPRGGGESSSPSSSGSSSSGSSSSGSSGSGSYGGGSPTYEAPRAAPSRPNRDDNGEQRRGGGSSSGQAVTRGSSGSSGSTRGTGSTAGSTAGSNDNSGGNREPVPAYSRPRDGRNATGSAVERRGGVPGSGGGGGVYYPGVIYDPYYYGYGYYDPYYNRRYTSWWSPYGYGYGLGYFAYDPYMFGGGYPYGPGGGYDPGGGYGSSGGGSYGTSRGGEVGSIRLKVKPSNAQVYVDGYYVGVIDSFDGTFQRLGIEVGTHKVEVRAEGYETVTFEVMVVPGETVTYKGELKRIH